MKPLKILITGANRGIGLEFVKQFIDPTVEIIATCRHPEKADQLIGLQTQAPACVKIESLDVSAPASVKHFVTQLGSQTIDILINNAGIFPKESGGAPWDTDALSQAFVTNTIGPLQLSEALLPNITASQEKLIVNITSGMGSIKQQSGSRRSLPYCVSKAALNMAMRILAKECAPQQIKILLVHPGWVVTDMGGESALLSVQESVAAMKQLIQQHQGLESGAFYQYDGQNIPW